MKIPHFIPAAPLTVAAVIFLAFAGGPVQAFTVLFYDDFSGGAVNLNGTAPDIRPGAETWVATPINFLANGTIGGGTGAGTATLAFTPVNGNIYHLDASLSGVSGDNNWIPFGFLDGQSVSNASSGGTQNRFLGNATVGRAWMFFRGSNDLAANPLNFNNATLGTGAIGQAGNPGNADPVSWLGPLGTADGGNIDMRIVLDTTGGAGNWTATWFAKRPEDADYTMVRDTATLLNESITAIGFGRSNPGVTGTITSFSLTLVPEPTRAVLLGLGALVFLRRRRA